MIYRSLISSGILIIFSTILQSQSFEEFSIEATPSVTGGYYKLGFTVHTDQNYAATGITQHDKDGNLIDTGVVIFDISTKQVISSFSPSNDFTSSYNHSWTDIHKGRALSVFTEYSSQQSKAFLIDLFTGEELTELLPSQPLISSDSICLLTDEYIIVSSLGGNESKGAVHVFDAITGNELHVLSPDELSNNSFFGSWVAINENLLAVASSNAFSGINEPGKVYIFDLNAGDLLYSVTGDKGAGGDYFGWRDILMTEDKLIVGSAMAEIDPRPSGIVYVYDIKNGNEIYKIEPGIEFFGGSLALNGNILAIGGYSPSSKETAIGMLIDLDTGQALASLVIPSDLPAMSRLPQRVLANEAVTAISMGNELLMYDINTGEFLERYTPETGSMNAWSALSGEHILASSEQKLYGFPTSGYADLDNDGFPDKIESQLLALANLPNDLSIITTPIDLLNLNFPDKILTEEQAALAIRSDPGKMNLYGLYTQDSINSIFLGNPIIWPSNNEVSIYLQLMEGADLESMIPLGEELLFKASVSASSTFFQIVGSSSPIKSTTTNLIKNGSFEQGLEAWVSSGNMIVHPNETLSGPLTQVGNDSALYFNNGNSTPNGILSQTFATDLDTFYTLTFYILKRGNSGQGYDQRVLLSIVNAQNDTSILHEDINATDISGGSFQYFDFTFKASSTLTRLQFSDLSNNTTLTDFGIDGITIRKSIPD